MWYLFEEQVHRLPASAECIWTREVSYTWHEAHTLALQYAQFLLALGVTPGQFVAFNLTNGPDFMLAQMACWAIGAFPAWINHNLAGEVLLHCIKLSKAKVLLVDEDYAIQDRVDEIKDWLSREASVESVTLDQSRKAEIMSYEPDRPGDVYRDWLKESDPHMLLYTSGSTGPPKAVVLDLGRAFKSSAGAVFFGLVGMRVHPTGDRFYNCMPFYHGTGGINAFGCMATGVTLCIGKRFRVSTFWDDIRDSRSTVSVYVGETLRYLLAQPATPRDRDHNVRMVFGNGLRPDVWKPFRDRFGIDTITEFFNSTEGVIAMFNTCRGDFGAHAVGHHGLINRTLLRNTWVTVPSSPESTGDILRSPTTNPPNLCPGRTSYSEGGEVLVAASSADPAGSGFNGYFENPEATETKFARDVFKPGDLWYRSGDALRRDDDGRWFFVDRLGDTFRWKSENVSTAEVGAAVGDFESILEANVYGVLVPGHDGRAGCAAVFIRSDGGIEEAVKKFNWQGLMNHLRKRLPQYAVPLFVRVVGAGDGSEITPSMHNNKQIKGPLRSEGIDLDTITAHGHKMLWAAPEVKQTYVQYHRRDCERLKGGGARL